MNFNDLLKRGKKSIKKAIKKFGSDDTAVKRGAAPEDNVVVAQNERKRSSSPDWCKFELDDYYADQVSKVTGWPYLKSLKKMMYAKKKIGISNRDYFVECFYEIPEEEQKEAYRLYKEQKAEKKAARKVDSQARCDAHAQYVADLSGWSFDDVKKAVRSTRERNGISYEYFDVFRFWELTPEEQDTYFTKGDADTLNKIYNVNRSTLQFFMNKDLFSKQFEEFMGRPYVPTSGLTKEALLEKFGCPAKIMYKPLSSSGGQGIQVFSYGEEEVDSVYETIKALPKGVLEGFLNQHPDMKKLSLNAVNTIRVVTIMTKDPSHGIEVGKVHFLYYGLRMATGTGYMDNLHSGGMIANIDPESGCVVTDAMDFANNVCKIHPDTGIEIKGFKIPCFDQIKPMIEKAGGEIEGYFGWDIAISENGPVIIEINTHPGAGILQTPYVPLRKGMHHVVAPYLPWDTRRDDLAGISGEEREALLAKKLAAKKKRLDNEKEKSSER